MEDLCNKTTAILGSSSGVINSSVFFLPHQFKSHQEWQDFFNTNCSQYFPYNGEQSKELYDPEYYSYRYRIIGTLVLGIILLVGNVGNVLVVIAVAKTKSLHSPPNCYIVSLACADIICLTATIPSEIIFYYMIGDRWIWGSWGCAIFTFAQFLGINSSALSVAAFTVERYIAICHPLKAHTMCTLKRAKKIIFGVWTFSIVYTVPWLFLTKLKPIGYKGFKDVMKCSFKLSREIYIYIFFVDFIAFTVIPITLSMILNGLITRNIYASRNIKTREDVVPKNGLRVTVSTNQKTPGPRNRLVVMLFIVVGLYAVLFLPYRGMVIYNSFAAMLGLEPFMDLWFLMFAKTCFYINSAINPMLYIATSVKFRQAFRHMLFFGTEKTEPVIMEILELNVNRCRTRVA